jgi:CBS domain-containing protein
MIVQDLMTNLVELVLSGDSVREAARIMRDQNVGFLPVARDDRLIGVVTDRDIVLRVVAAGRDPALVSVDDVMTAGAKYCYEDEDALHVAANMEELGVSRLPVMNRDQRLVGVISADDFAPLRNYKPGGYSPTMGAVLP